MIKSKLQSQFPPSFIQTFTEQAWTLCFVPEDIFKIDFTNFQGPVSYTHLTLPTIRA